VRLSPDLRDRIESAAAADRRANVSEFIRILLEDALQARRHV
jgi:Arc/MetJ-type ribon-helix-helix transcriptional regulator